MRRLLLTTIGLLMQLVAMGQIIFPDLSGEELAEALRDNFRPETVMTYGESRDTLWRNIDSQGDSLFCVYTGFGVELDPALDPTQDAFGKGINAEHTYPRAFGADFGNPLADMHNLFPTRVQVNSDRGNLPFGNINDNQTDDWYFMDQEQSSPPLSNRNLYSERLQAMRFEPREDHKGNVARAMFYFYTIYRPEADAADDDWIVPQLNSLCNWHLEDPVDQRELDRSTAIAFYQDGKENPFVLDCSLVRRAYCPDLPEQQCLTSTNEAAQVAESHLQIIGSYGLGQNRRLTIEILQNLYLEVDWYDTLGRKLASSDFGLVESGQFDVVPQIQLLSGPVIAQLKTRANQGWSIKTVVIP
ncbi:MAG: endonuclease [Bacteroidota bacterium]